MTKTRLACCLLVAMFAVVCSRAHADDAATLYEAAKKEGQVVWYTSLIVNQAVRPLVAAFNKKYPGIAVKYARGDSGPNAIKVINRRAPARSRATCSTASPQRRHCSRPAWSNRSPPPTPTNIRPRCAIPTAAG